MKKTKQRRRSDDAQSAIIVEPVREYGVDYGSSTKPGPVANTSHVAAKPAPRTSQLCALLSSETGANLHEICVAFGWQTHSARAALSGLRKSGTAVERINFAVSDDGTGSLAKGPTRYRIALAGGAAS